MNQQRISRILSSSGPWLLLAGSVTFLLSLNSIDSGIGWLFAILSIFAICIDPLAFSLLPSPSFRAAKAYYRTRLISVWTVFAASILLFVIRSLISLPLDKTGAVEDSPIGRIRSLLLVLFLAGLIGGFLYRLWLGLEAASEDTVRDPDIRSRFGSLAALQVIGLIVLLSGFNVLASYRNASLDLTPGLYSYSEPARAVIGAIDRPIRIIAFLPVQQVIRDTGRRTTPSELLGISEELRVLIEQIRLLNSQLQVEILNADLIEPGNSEYRGVTNGTILVRSYTDEAAAKTPFAERRVYVYGEKDLDRFEKNLVEALVHVSLPPTKIYLARSNGERGASINRPSPDALDEWITSMRFYNFTVSMIDPGPGIRIPDDARVVVLAGPTVPYSESSRQSIIRYLDGGGSVLAFADPTGREDFSWLLEHVGSPYRVQPAFLSMFSDHPGLLRTQSLSDHRAVNALKTVARAVFFFSGQGFFEKQTDVTASSVYNENLLIHSDGQTFRDRNRNGRIEPGEEAGRFVLSLLYEGQRSEDPGKSEGPAPGKLILFSDPVWLTNALLSLPVEKDNIRLGLDTMLWLVGGNDIPGVVVKERTDRAIQVNDELKLRNIVLGVFGFPVASGLILAASLYFYRRRRAFRGNDQ